MASLHTHYFPEDPGVVWEKCPTPVIEAEVSSDTRVLTPDVVKTNKGFYRMYFSEGLRPDRRRKTSRIHGWLNSSAMPIGGIVSAISTDGKEWVRERGSRIEPNNKDREIWCVCPDVIRIGNKGYRMYFQSRCTSGLDVIRSAWSRDGLEWIRDNGVRLESSEASYGSPKCIYVGENSYRLYCHEYPQPFCSGLEAGNKIISAKSNDSLTFYREPGIRICQDNAFEDYAVYAPEVVRLSTGTYRIYYAGWSADPLCGRIFSATSDDGLNWIKSSEICVDVGGRHQELKVSEPSVSLLPNGEYNIYYEASDRDGAWRIFRSKAIKNGRALDNYHRSFV